MSETDSQFRSLMTASQQGDRDAYRRLLGRCDAWLRSYFAGKVPSAHVDDLVQETLVSIHRKRASYDPNRPFLPWLAVIARYRWVDHLRKFYRRGETILPEDLASPPEQDDVMARHSLDRLLGRLPAGQALVIRLVKIEGLTIAEASDHTGQSQSLVKVNIHRGLRKLGGLVDK